MFFTQAFSPSVHVELTVKVVNCLLVSANIKKRIMKKKRRAHFCCCAVLPFCVWKLLSRMRSGKPKAPWKENKRASDTVVKNIVQSFVVESKVMEPGR
jgi:hypothetical protein